MKKINNILAVIAMSAAAILVCMPSGETMAQDSTSNDSTVTAIKLKSLNTRRDNIKKQIEIEDAKRGKTYEGVSAETKERLNILQDSICLELRSELVSVELQIAELSPKTDNRAVLLQQYNALKVGSINSK